MFIPRTQQPIKWFNVVSITAIHLMSIYALTFWSLRTRIETYIWGTIVLFVNGFGTTAGAHRLWCHRAYKAKLPLQLILIFCFSTAGQNSIYDWVRDHRVHHKYSETDADPHNANRGFFFAHVGWLMQSKHPEVIKKGALIDMSDITDDPLLAFHTKYFRVFWVVCCFIIPSIVPYLFWDEDPIYAFVGLSCVRYVLNLNFTWLVNSAAHIWGNKPYDKRIQPAENKVVAFFAMGEGWHNYHHVFPWDYKTAEIGNYKLNFTTAIIDAFAKIGWAYDLKSPPPELIRKVVGHYGDGSHPEYEQDNNHNQHHEVQYPDEENNKKLD